MEAMLVSNFMEKRGVFQLRAQPMIARKRECLLYKGGKMQGKIHGMGLKLAPTDKHGFHFYISAPHPGDQGKIHQFMGCVQLCCQWTIYSQLDQVRSQAIFIYVHCTCTHHGFIQVNQSLSKPLRLSHRYAVKRDPIAHLPSIILLLDHIFQKSEGKFSATGSFKEEAPGRKPAKILTSNGLPP